ncbi:MAG: hypothetical protein Q7J09_10725 [Methanocalculus sp.]|uniref:hypothetical protein n=1 Tax=Methanocalculus sp. TaxID=2004547 RepID=UPI0027168510|nr:hypothetical protein [Methanocalculus sp.]MDO8841402.1 hypothetical protein [Methanocalculus sp.]MDO9540456.1 hypothetical protein [Methanocalculus sp.]
MAEEGERRRKEKVTGRHLRCIRNHPLPVIFFTFLGGVGVGAVMTHRIGQMRERRREEQKSSSLLRLILTLATPYLIRRLIR